VPLWKRVNRASTLRKGTHNRHWRETSCSAFYIVRFTADLPLRGCNPTCGCGESDLIDLDLPLAFLYLFWQDQKSLLPCIIHFHLDIWRAEREREKSKAFSMPCRLFDSREKLTFFLAKEIARAWIYIYMCVCKGGVYVCILRVCCRRRCAIWSESQPR
jgi:hypothetical protein